MIIGLTGLKGSGKDTVGAYLVKNHGFERRSFADPLKRSFAAFFDVPVSDLENLKNLQDCKVMLGEFANGDQSGFIYSDMSVRQALQRYGTEAHRDVFGHDFWVDQALPVDGFYSGRAIVITDLRFQSEAYRIRLLEGTIIRIKRGVTLEEDLHVSEVEQLNIVSDHDIYNDGTVEELFEQVEEVLTQIG